MNRNSQLEQFGQMLAPSISSTKTEHCHKSKLVIHPSDCVVKAFYRNGQWNKVGQKW